MGFRWETTPETAFTRLAEAYTSALHRGVRAIALARAPEIENWLKDNASWTDRTGNARQTLHTEVEDVVNRMVRIILSHGVDYGIYLELSNAGRYAIVNPGLDHWAPILWRDVREMMGR